MAARAWSVFAVLMLFTAGCAAPAPQVKRIVLFAPFESTTREIGYDALYPVKLALADEAATDIQLLSIDDGGSTDAAILRAQSLAADPTIILALVAGPIATDSRVLSALQDIPAIVIGYWSATPDESVFILASDQISSQVTALDIGLYDAAARREAIGGEVFGLKAFAALSEDTSNITVITSAAQASAELRERLLASDLYVPEPGLLATLAYDAGALAARAAALSTDRAEVLTALRSLNMQGINGEIAFDAQGYWADAPVYEYRYTGGVLTLNED